MLLHIGYHKTGSTWLQRTVFSSPTAGFTTETGVPRHQLVHDLVRPDVFDPIPAEIVERYTTAAARARDSGLQLVVSHERFAGYPASGGYDRKLIADRLAAHFPDARILIVIREQVSLIHSMYNQYVTDGGDLPLRVFLQDLEPQLGRMPYFRFSYYAFDALIAYYQTLFGKDRVLTLAYETLRASPQEFANAIADFAGTPRRQVSAGENVNTRRPVLMQETARLANRLFSRNELSPASLIAIPRLPRRFGSLRPFFDAVVPDSLDRRMSAARVQRIRDAVGPAYRASNARTAALTGLTLRNLGYAWADEPHGSGP